ncbi:hypothetical protein TNIN_143541 [Trichonephila inaurata madagascariensis]|uniref:Uncharacterized protein n=1 Tax=Trichonephila inaurata madagascariensis TaxID=2747483 RepID=A0A8X6XFW6_9ARAC|nr:hypothetical protein TNIN_143541 [Trichonephila inaurata madagascariensis]
MVSELRTMPHVWDPNGDDHTILKSNDSDPDLSLINVNDEKQSYKRKNNKQDLEGFAFPKKTIRPTTPTQVLQPIPTRNNFESLNQDPEPMEEEQSLKKSLAVLWTSGSSGIVSEEKSLTVLWTSGSSGIVSEEHSLPVFGQSVHS